MDGEAVYYWPERPFPQRHHGEPEETEKPQRPVPLAYPVPEILCRKRELVEQCSLATRDRIIVVDPMGEYSPLIRRLGGQGD